MNINIFPKYYFPSKVFLKQFVVSSSNCGSDKWAKTTAHKNVQTVLRYYLIAAAKCIATCERKTHGDFDK